jgi:hypothetical protein
MPSRRKRTWRSIGRRLIAAGALFAYLAATIGLPLPPPLIIKDGGKPFMCQGHACGCQTAEECWRHCCCHTPEERWAWAEEHHVQPPEYAEKPATIPVRDCGPSRATAVSAVLDCGNTAETAVAHASLCHSTEAFHAASCPCCKGDGLSVPRRALTSTPLRGVAVSPLRCQGLTTQWVTTGVVPTGPPACAPLPEPAATGRLFPADWLARRVTQSPPSRPPRLPFSA